MVEFLLKVAGVLAGFLVLPLVVGQTEHKVMAHMQAVSYTHLTLPTIYSV